MEEASSSQNANCDKTERSRRRLSSILKAPRTPLQDLGVGNEFNQECFQEKRRKSSRRVSFAEPIKAVAAELQGRIDEQGKGTDSRKSVTFEPETTEDSQCAITGMDTLLHAPIQNPEQQLEIWDGDQENANKTIMFCEDASMDITASNTILITRNDFENSDTDIKSHKIDITSFLATLRSGNKPLQRPEEFSSEMQSTVAKSTFNVQTTDSTHLENKINVSDFLARLKPTPKFAPALLEDDEKENRFAFDLNLHESRCTASSVPFSTPAFPEAQENANISCIFKDKDNAVDFTQCHTVKMETFFPPSEDSQKQFEHESNMFFGASSLNMFSQKKTGFEGMCSDQKFKMDSTQNIPVTHCRFENKFSNRTNSKSSVQNRAVMFDIQNETVAFNDELDLTKCHTVQIDRANLQTSQKYQVLPLLHQVTAVSAASPQEEKTMIFAESEQAMDITKPLPMGINCTNSVGVPPSHNVTSQRVGTASAIPSENTGNVLVVDMDFTRSDTVAFEMHSIEQQYAPEERVPDNSNQNDGTNINLKENTVSNKTCFRRNNVENSQLLSQEDNTIGFAFDHMDLTGNASLVVELNETGSQFPHSFKSVEKFSKVNKPNSFNIKPVLSNLKELTPVNVCKSHSGFIDGSCIKIPSKPNSSGGCLGKMVDLKECEFGASNMFEEKFKFVHCTQLLEKSDLQLTERTTVFAGHENDMDFTNHCTNIAMHVVREETVETSFQNTHFSLLPSNTDVTTIFKNQDDKLDLTTSHTANIQVFPFSEKAVELKTIVAPSTSVLSDDELGKTVNPLSNTSFTTPAQGINGNEEKKAEDTSNCNSTKTNTYQTNHTEPIFQCAPMRHECGNEAVIIDETMDVTKMHTVQSSKIVCSEMGSVVDKGIMLADFNEYMAQTKKHTVLNNNNLKAACHLSQNDASSAGKSPIVPSSTEDEMDITKSHTVAIDGHVIRQMSEDALLSVLNTDQGIEDTIQEPIKELEQNAAGNFYQRKHAYNPNYERLLVLQLPTNKTMAFLNEDMDQTGLLTAAVNPKAQDDLLSETQTFAKKCLPIIHRFDTTISNFADDMDIARLHACSSDDKQNQKPTIEKHNDVCSTSVEQLKLDGFTVCKQSNRNQDLELSASPNTNAVLASKDCDQHLTQDLFTIERDLSKPTISVHPYIYPCPATHMDRNTNLIKAASDQMPNSLHRECHKAFEAKASIVNEIPELAANFHQLNNTQQKLAEKITVNLGAQYPENISQSDKTILFSGSGEMDSTRNDTIAIDNRKIETAGCCTTETSRMNRSVFCVADNHMDITQSHTVAIDQQNMVKSPNASLPFQSGFSNEKCWDDPKMDMSDGIELNSAEKASFHIKMVKSQTYQVQPILHQFESDVQEDISLTGFIPINKTNDTQEIQNINFKHVEPSSKLSKSLLLCDSFVVPVLNQQQEMEMTVCNTVFINDQNVQLPNNQLNNYSSNINDVVNQNCPIEHCTVNPDQKMEAAENHAPGRSACMITLHHLPNNADASTEAVPLKFSLQGIAQNCEEEMDVTKSHVTAIEKVNMQISIDAGAASGADDMEVTNSHSDMCIQNKMEPVQLYSTDLSRTKKSLHSFRTDKSILFSGDDDVDITRSPTVGLVGQIIGMRQRDAQLFMSATSNETCTIAPGSKSPPDEVVLSVTEEQISLAQNNILPACQRSPSPKHLANDKTVCLCEDMALTKSYNVVTDTRESETLNSSLPENTEALLTPNDTLSVMSKGIIGMDITKSHTVCIVGPHTELHEVPMVSKLYKHLGKSILGIREKEPYDISSDQIEMSRNTTITKPKPEGSINCRSPSEKHTILYKDCEDMELTYSTKSIRFGCGRSENTDTTLKSSTVSVAETLCPRIQENISNITNAFLKVDKMDETLCHTTKIESVCPVAHGYGAKNIDLVEQNDLAQGEFTSACDACPKPIGIEHTLISTGECTEEAIQTLALKNTKPNCFLNSKHSDFQCIVSAKEYENRSEKCDKMGEQYDNGIAVHHDVFHSGEQSRTATAIRGVDMQFIVPHDIDIQSKPTVSFHVCEGSVSSKSKGLEEAKINSKDMELSQIGSDHAHEGFVNQPFANSHPSAMYAEIQSVPCMLDDRSQTDKKSRRRSLADIQSKLERLKRQGEAGTASHSMSISNLLNPLPKSSDMSNGNKKSENNPSVNRASEELESKNVEATNSAVTVDGDTLMNTICKLKRLPLGMFEAKLPNKRKSYLPDKRTDSLPSDSEMHSSCQTVPDRLLVCSSNKGETCQPEYIIEEVFPSCLEEGESNHLLSYEVPEGTWKELHEMEVVHGQTESDAMPIKACSRQKRSIDLVDKEELQNEKKRKKEDWALDSRECQNPHTFTDLSSNQANNINSASARSTTKTSSSSTSSSDSRADGLTTDLSQQFIQAESHISMDNSVELNLRKRLQDGGITVKEFFMLLNLGTLIQRPRFSEVPDNYDVNVHPCQEDLMSDRYIYRTKLQVYEEDCLALSNTIEELKHCVNAQDKPLVQVNGLLWEVLRTCSENELKFLSAETKKMKSNFTLKSKVFSHKEKVKRYGKLLAETRIQSEKLNSTVNDVDKLLEEMDTCISALHKETAQLEMSAHTLHGSDEICKTEMVPLECREAMLNRELSRLEERKQTILFEMKSLQRKASNLDKYLSEYNFSEWEISEWDEHGAIFTFLYGSVELTISFGDTVDGVQFCSKSCRKISDVSFESLLNDESAPASSLLVQRLVFQFIERKQSLLEKYMTMNELPQFLFDISLVVSRCRLLGEEIEFLMKWGGKFNLLKTEIHNTRVKLIFSSIEAYAKFEVLFCLSENYPSTALSFTVLKRIGKIGQEEISAVMSNVLQGTNYLRRAVQQIHCNLLQTPVH